MERTRYINGEKWSYSSPGPIIEWGEHDIRSTCLPRPYLRQYVLDQCREKCVIKPRQSEQTENQINENLYYALVHGAKISHIFPTDEIGDAISNEKIRPAISESPDIAALVRGQGAVRRYLFRSGGVYTVHGALKRAGGRASSRDILVFDEFDFMPADIFGVYEQLLSHSALHLVRKISTPTTPDTGIDAAVKAGAGWHWHWTCQKCGKEQEFAWPDSCINFFPAPADTNAPEYRQRLDRVYLGCRHCGDVVDRCGAHYLQSSRWLAQRPDLVQSNSSYVMNAAQVPWKTGKELLRKYHKLGAYEWQWWNEVWGAAFLMGESRLYPHEIEACQGQWRMPAALRLPVMRNLSMGVDWGEKQSWVVICCSGMNANYPNKRCVAYVEEICAESLQRQGYEGKSTDHVRRVEALIGLFNPGIVLNDANGIGIDRNSYLVQKFPDRAWGVFFDTVEMGKQGQAQSRLIIPQWVEARRKVTISKTNAVRTLQQEYRDHRVEIPQITGPEAEVLRKFVGHGTSLAVQPRWSDTYERPFEIVVKISSDDHLYDAHMYAQVGWMELVGGNTDVPALTIF